MSLGPGSAGPSAEGPGPSDAPYPRPLARPCSTGDGRAHASPVRRGFCGPRRGAGGVAKVAGQGAGWLPTHICGEVRTHTLHLVDSWRDRPALPNRWCPCTHPTECWRSNRVGPPWQARSRSWTVYRTRAASDRRSLVAWARVPGGDRSRGLDIGVWPCGDVGAERSKRGTHHADVSAEFGRCDAEGSHPFADAHPGLSRDGGFGVGWGGGVWLVRQ